MSTPRYTLVIGNKNYSSWSLRPWLLMKQSGIAFDEVRIPLYGAGSKEEIRNIRRRARSPRCWTVTVTVWDSLAICEYLAERHPELHLWPADTGAACDGALGQRGDALRLRRPALEYEHELPRLLPRGGPHGRSRCRYRAHPAHLERCREHAASRARSCSAASPSPMLMYAPVVLRFKIYAVQLSPVCRQYADAILALPALQQWVDGQQKPR